MEALAVLAATGSEAETLRKGAWVAGAAPDSEAEADNGPDICFAQLCVSIC